MVAPKQDVINSPSLSHNTIVSPQRLENAKYSPLISSMMLFLQKKLYKDAIKAASHRDRATMRTNALKTFRRLIKIVSARFGLEDLMWILASSLHIKPADMKEQTLVVGDVAAHLLDGIPLCGAKASAKLTAKFHSLLKILANLLEPTVVRSHLAIHIMRCWSIAYLNLNLK